MGLRMSCVSGVQMTRCLAFRELRLLRRHAEFIVIIANYCIFQFLDPLGSRASACAQGSQLDAYPWSSPGEAGSEQGQSPTETLLEPNGPSAGSLSAGFLSLSGLRCSFLPCFLLVHILLLSKPICFFPVTFCKT